MMSNTISGRSEGSRGNVTTIRQGSQRVVIDWASFDIDPNDVVRFLQPGGDAVALRRHYYADGPPKVTKRQAELYGLVAYDGYAGNTVEDLAQ